MIQGLCGIESWIEEQYGRARIHPSGSTMGTLLDASLGVLDTTAPCVPTSTTTTCVFVCRW